METVSHREHREHREIIASSVACGVLRWLLIHMKIYHPICNMNRKVLPSFSVLVIAPKFGFASSNPGSANWGVLKRLIDSARNVSRKSFLNPHERWSDALTFRIGPLRKTLRPRFPRASVGLMN